MRTVFVMLLVACSSPEKSVEPDAAHSSGDSGSAIDAPGSTGGTCANKTAQPLDATWTIAVGGANRIAKVHVPASYDPSKRTPLLIDVHGRTQTASAQMTLSKSKEKADAEGFIVIHPESATSPTAWNSGSCCEPATTNNVDDTGFMRKLIDEAESKLCIDPARIYMMGMSNGGYESHRIACELADRVAAVGPVTGLLLFSGCSPSRPVPVMMINGTADTLSQYQYVGQTVNFWKGKNGCTTQMQTYQNGDTTCVTHGGCTAGADVVLCTVQEGGHQWPGGGSEFPFLGKKSNDIIATDALWDFFAAHPKP